VETVSVDDKTAAVKGTTTGLAKKVLMSSTLGTCDFLARLKVGPREWDSPALTTTASDTNVVVAFTIGADSETTSLTPCTDWISGIPPLLSARFDVP
jgi:hypothetical protein